MVTVVLDVICVTSDDAWILALLAVGVKTPPEKAPPEVAEVVMVTLLYCAQLPTLTNKLISNTENRMVLVPSNPCFISPVLEFLP